MKGNLLIIDDEKNLTDILKQILSKYADNVFVTNTGAAGLRIIAEEEIHCVICDIFMPELTGIQVIQNVRESGNLVPFIFFTAHGVEELEMEVSAFDRTLFLVKPDISGIVQIIDKMLKLGFENSPV